MYRFFLFVLLSLLTSSTFAQDGFESLFNGKDLSGWKGDTSLWSVEDGCITGKTNGPDHLEYNKFLIWDGTAADFEFRCEFRLEGENNSGVQYRSVHHKSRGDWVCVGYQADIHANPPYTGMLYDEKGRGIIAKRGEKVVVKADGKKVVTALKTKVEPIDVSQWHELTIIARGNQLIHKIDGVVTVNVKDEQTADAETEGLIAFQVHRGKAMKAQFRNVRLKKLPRRKKDAAPERATAEWIWINEGDSPAAKVYFRKEVDSSGVAAARLYAACDDQMTIYVDGKKIIEHGDWSKPIFADISAQLDLDDPQKQHVIAVEAENGASAAGLIVQLDLESGWRDAWSIPSDKSWLASTQPQQGWKTLAFKPDDSWRAPDVLAALGGGPWAEKINAATLAAAATLRQPTATPAENLRVAKGFKVELLYSVPKEEQGSWVNMCSDPAGRLIVSDQYGSLYRVTPPGIRRVRVVSDNGQDQFQTVQSDQLTVEKINVDIGEAQGLLWAFDSLYVSVNKGTTYAGGLYRVRDTDNDDQLDSVETLRPLNGSGEHGPHAVLPHPDGQSLYVVCGNRTDLTQISGSRIPATWDEDQLLPRVQGKFMRGTRAPGGCIYRIDPDGKHWEVVASGFRNQYDAALNRDGELFTYDADMEWDVNTPWYRPTRICHVLSGAEFGWRSGGGKWPVYYPDSVPPVVNVGPGSPTGVTFGYGSNFPEPYQNALYAADWSYGKLYAVHLQPQGGTFTGTLEEFVTGTPLPLTDVIVNPTDKAMYFLIGGRKVQSGLYRVTYNQGDSIATKNPVASDSLSLKIPAEELNARSEPLSSTSSESSTSSGSSQKSLLALRRQIESMHTGDHPGAVNTAWPYLRHPARAIRYAARIALEHRPVAEWQDRALAETDPQALLTALLGLARCHERHDKGEPPNIDTPIPDWNHDVLNPEKSLLTSRVLEAVDILDWGRLDDDQRIQLLRVLTVTFLRISPPNAEERDVIVERLEHAFPTLHHELNSELAQLMVYLQAPYAPEKLVDALESAPTQEQQIDFARTLRHQLAGWSPELRQRYFTWFVRASTFRGGASFKLFVDNIKEEAVARLTPEELASVQSILDAQPTGELPAFSTTPREFVREWKMEELLPLVESGLSDRDFDHGRQMFAAAACFACHRFDNQGGSVGPDLTALSGRFSVRDLLESIVEPSKQISDQYEAVQIVTVDGKSVTGRIVNLAGDAFRVQTNMLEPSALVSVDRKQIEEIFPSKTSMMPTGLLNTLNEEEIRDLMAYLLSRGDRTNRMFGQKSQ